MTRHLKTVQSWLARPGVFWWAVALAALLPAPSLWGGLAADDYFHQLVLRGDPRAPSISPLDLFAFLPGDPAYTRRLMDLGVLPWWTLEELKITFWRPFASLTHYLEHRLWPNWPGMMHAQNLLWYAGLVAVVAALYRRLLQPAWVAGLAALLYAVDDAHGLPVGWLANRNALIAAVFGLLTLLVHDRWRREGWWPGAWLGPVILALGLLSAEATLAVGAYLLAYAIFLDRGTWKARLARLVPYGTVVGIWRLWYQHLGYGAWGSGFYVDPVREPGLFAAAALDRAPVLLLGQLGLPPSDLWMQVPVGARPVLWFGFVACLTLMGGVVVPLLRREALARFWALGLLLTILPICATFPSDRLLFFSGLGAMGLVAQFLGTLADRPLWLPTARAWRIPAFVLGMAWIGIHGILAPLLLPPRSLTMALVGRIVERMSESAPIAPDVVHQSLIIVNTPDQFFTELLPTLRAFRGDPVPNHTWCLTASPSPVEVTRLDAHTLVVRPEGGYMAGPMDSLFRGRSHPMAVGRPVPLSRMTIQVTAVTQDGRPAEATFRFAVPLEDPSLRWVVWQNGGFVPFNPPRVGQKVVVSGAELGPLF